MHAAPRLEKLGSAKPFAHRGYSLTLFALILDKSLINSSCIKKGVPLSLIDRRTPFSFYPLLNLGLRLFFAYGIHQGSQFIASRQPLQLFILDQRDEQQQTQVDDQTDTDP